MAIADDILDATIRHSVFLERHKGGTVRRILELVREFEDRAILELLKHDLDKMSSRQLDRLLDRLQKLTKDGYEPVISLLREEVKGLADHEGRWQIGVLDATIPIDLDLRSVAAPQIYAAVRARPFQGLLLSEWYRGLPDGQFRRLRGAIREGFLEGKTTAQVVQDIRGTRTRTGVLKTSRRAAEATARTALNHTANVAREEVYKANKSRIKGVEWVSTLDGRTTAVCRARDGKVYAIDKGPRPPAHVNCRSATIPVIKSARALGLKNLPGTTRSSLNGKVSAEIDYDGWLRKQSREFQDEVLGRRKAQLFRAGLKMDRYIDRAGNELTLEQLRTRERSIWDKAFN